mmetsp:Transcript_5493/g.11798  ORF Transcript_5493/g.11798 Transcript_5493/m.11798 type:complete len:106 (+) Transcript_5493:616-933(+)
MTLFQSDSEFVCGMLEENNESEKETKIKTTSSPDLKANITLHSDESLLLDKLNTVHYFRILCIAANSESAIPKDHSTSFPSTHCVKVISLDVGWNPKPSRSKVTM